MSEMAQTRNVDIGHMIDENPLTSLQLRVMILCGIIITLDGYDIQSLALTVPTLMGEWSLQRGDFVWAVTASLFGYGFGAAFIAGLGDRYGRRPILIVAAILMGVGSIGTGYVHDMTQLIVWRFLTGVGFGTSVPNCTAITSEYVPAARRALLLTLMYAGVAFGALVAGLVAPSIVKAYGWRAIFFIGGVLPLAAAALLYAGLPESVRFLVAKRPGDPRLAKILAQLAPGVDAGSVRDARAGTERQSITSLLTPLYRPRTILLWTIFAFNLFALYYLISWLPALLKGAGWTVSDSQRGGVLLQAGGIVTGMIVAWCIDKRLTVPAMVTAYLATALSFGLFIVLPSTGAAWWLLLFVIGAGTSGTQFALNALAAEFYPTAIRSTGVGWAVGVGRIGAILGPLSGGIPALAHLSTANTLGLLIVPVVLCAAGTMILPRIWRG
jgi:AAHS family 4-hydroxybenzoate transporter-like MFS transporter